MVKSMFRFVAAAALLAAAIAPAAQPASQDVGGVSRSDSQDQAAAVLASNDLNKDGKVDKAEIARNLASIQNAD